MIMVADALSATGQQAGQGELEVQRVAGCSSAVAAWATSPLKLLTPCSRGTSVWACLSSFGGGLVAGDRNDFQVRLGRDSRCYLGTQASTKVYRNPLNLPSGHRLEAVLDDGSLLVLAPDPVQAFAGSSYVQEQSFRLRGNASLVLLDWNSAGRVACGERWAFGSFQSRNEIFVEDQRVFMDALRLSAGDRSLSISQRMGRFNVLASLVLIGPQLEAFAGDILEAVNSSPVQKGAPLVFSASPIRGGVLLRLAGESVETIGREVHRHLRPLAELLGDDPWERKW